MKAWKEGDLAILLTEGRTLQQRLPKAFTKQKEQNLARSFANLMFKGKTHAALDLLTNGGLLHIEQPVNASLPNSELVGDILRSKHPVGQPAVITSILQTEPPDIHSIHCP